MRDRMTRVIRGSQARRALCPTAVSPRRMPMKTFVIAGIVLMVGLAGCDNCPFICGSCSGDGDNDSKEMAVAVDQVPAEVLAAAERIVPGINVTKVTMETEDGETCYEIVGTDKDGKAVEVEVEVDASGKVTEVEKDDD
jgi:hypothetical protein